MVTHGLRNQLPYRMDTWTRYKRLAQSKTIDKKQDTKSLTISTCDPYPRKAFALPLDALGIEIAYIQGHHMPCNRQGRIDL